MVSKKRKTKKEMKKRIARDYSTKVKRVRLSNKGRKGWFYYVKEAGKKGRYYKEKKGINVENYLNAYKGKVKFRKGGVPEWKEGKSPSEIYIKSIKKRGQIDEIIGKGQSEINVPRVLGKMKLMEIRKKYEEKLRPLVKDKDLLKILSLPENVQKFKHRLQITTRIEGDDGKIIVLKCFNKTMEEVFNDLGKIIDKKNVYGHDLSVINKEKKHTIESTQDVEYRPDSPKYNEVLLIKLVKQIKVNIRYVKGR